MGVVVKGASIGPNIITDDLVLYLDAANSKSYPGTGTDWYDLSGNNNHGTLINGVGYTNQNNGSLVFDGVNDYISLPWGNGINPFSESYTFICFLKSNQTTSGAMWLDHGSNGTNQRFYSSLNSLGTQGTAWSNSTPNDTNWHMNYILCDGNGNISLYQDNSNLQVSRTVTSYTVPSNFELGGRLTSYSWSGNISYFLVYNRTLTINEIKQNFNAIRGRYGI